MVSNFTPETPVLYFGPRHHARWSACEFVLWPAWTYRVVAPRRKPRKLNLLQRAVLGLCRAGRLRIEEHAACLDIHQDLADLIIIELSSLGFLDRMKYPTKDGLMALSEDSIEGQELVAGYVFQDPWSGDLWPRFVERLDYCELERDERGYPILMMGSTGKPKRKKAFTVLPVCTDYPQSPQPLSIIKAVARHQKEKKFKLYEDTLDDDLEILTLSETHIDRVSLIESVPQPVLLTTYLYVPESESEAFDWFACDPFGFGQSPRLHKSIESAMQNMQGLYRVVNRLVGKSLHEGYEEQRRWHDGLKLKAEMELEQRFTVDIRTSRMFMQLVDLEAAWQEIVSIGEACPVRKINEALRGGVKVLEAGFAAMAADFPLGDSWKRVYVERIDSKSGKTKLVQQNNREIVAATITGATGNIGFQLPPPESLTNIKPGQIRAVADYGDFWRLRPLVAVTLLLADQESSHPLRLIGKRCPDFLERVEDVANRGGRAGHASEAEVTIEDARQQVENVYSLVEMMCESRTEVL